MQSIQSKIPGSITNNLGVFKEPRGLIRLLQFIFAIFAFATACSGSSSTSLKQTPTNNEISASWSYPYNLKTSFIKFSGNKTDLKSISDANDVKSSAEFFVFTGVTSMLLSIAFAVVYVVMDQNYRNDERLPIVDLVVAVVWAIFWIAGSSAWAKGVSNIRTQTSPTSIEIRSNMCSNDSCSTNYSGTYGSIIVSVLFGFLNFILWTGCAWFVFKETRFFKGQTANQQQPQAPQPTFTDINTPTRPQVSTR